MLDVSEIASLQKSLLASFPFSTVLEWGYYFHSQEFSNVENLMDKCGSSSKLFHIMLKKLPNAAYYVFYPSQIN